MTYVVFFARCTLLLVFVAALGGKLRSRAAWSSFVAATGTLLSVGRTRVLWAVAAVLTEGAVAVCLLLNDTAYSGLFLALAGLALFLVVVLSGVVRGVETACNCFGAAGSSLSWTHVWRNLMLVVVAAAGCGAATASRTPSMFVGTAYATPIVLSFIAAALFVIWDDMTFLLVGRPSE